MITTILIDDEKDAIENLAWQIETYCNQLKILDKISCPKLAISKIKKLQPDCIFIDIHMPLLSGFEVIKVLENQPFKTIFTTGYREYALKAIKASVFDYLLKPIDKSDLLETITKLEQNLLRKDTEFEKIPETKKIKIRVDGSMHFFNPEEIIFLKAESNYTDIHLTNKRKLTLCKTLKDVEQELEIPNFFRSHKSYLINLFHVKEYKNSDGGSLVMSEGHYASLSRKKKHSFFDLMK